MEDSTRPNLIDELFTYHRPSDDQVPKYGKLRNAGHELALIIDECCPPSADRTAAMRQLQDCIMTANRSIALDGKSYR